MVCYLPFFFFFFSFLLFLANGLVYALDIITPAHEHIGKAIWGDFVPNALANGQLQAKPDPLVAGKGLEDIQHAMNVQMNGVSAKKVVVSI